jgi:hypothetical protein
VRDKNSNATDGRKLLLLSSRLIAVADLSRYTATKKGELMNNLPVRESPSPQMQGVTASPLR